jgi:hypothetical protein
LNKLYPWQLYQKRKQKQLRHEIVKKIEEDAKAFNHKYTEKEIKEMVKR